MQLTNRQAQILKFIARFIVENQRPPSLREIGDTHSIASTNGVQDHLNVLERKGALDQRHGRGCARAYRVTKEGFEASCVEARLMFKSR